VTQQGDIKDLKFSFSKKALISSARDINSVSIEIQHANPKNDVSVISAGRDIRYLSKRNNNGTLETDTNGIVVAGAGDLLVESGRNIDFGVSAGLRTRGNLDNKNLPDSGANITALVGLNGAALHI